MKTRVQLGLLKLADPRVARFLLLGLMVALMLLGYAGEVHADPVCGEGGCGGG